MKQTTKSLNIKLKEIYKNTKINHDIFKRIPPPENPEKNRVISKP
jgi:hypothetical protein